MDTYVVGDIHGRVEVVDYFLDIARQCSDTQVIFLGDFLDSFDRSVDDQIRSLQKVLVAIQETGRVRSILGNHEASYLDPGIRCSGWNPETQNYFNLLKGSVTLDLETYIWLDDILITHAGLSQRFIDETQLSVEQNLNNNLLWNKVGKARGGWQGVGGIRWNDFNQEFKPVEGVRQIFGHTAGPDIRKKFRYIPKAADCPQDDTNSESWCIDCLDYKNKCVVVRDGVIEEFEFDLTY